MLHTLQSCTEHNFPICARTVPGIVPFCVSLPMSVDRVEVKLYPFWMQASSPSYYSWHGCISFDWFTCFAWAQEIIFYIPSIIEFRKQKALADMHHLEHPSHFDISVISSRKRSNVIIKFREMICYTKTHTWKAALYTYSTWLWTVCARSACDWLSLRQAWRQHQRSVPVAIKLPQHSLCLPSNQWAPTLLNQAPSQLIFNQSPLFSSWAC